MGKNNRIFCFGEVLWDEVDGVDYPGGAPLNVAYHMAKDDRFDVYMISSVGKDPAGCRMLELIDGWSIDRRFVKVADNHSTGRVVANVSDKNKVSYDILRPVAWDYIHEDGELNRYIQTDDCLVFGTLACRSTVSRQSLFTLLSGNCFRAFDVNLRGNYYDKAMLTALLANTDLLKISDDELPVIAGLLDPSAAQTTEKGQLDALMADFNIGEAIVTRGADGAGYYKAGEQVDVPGVTVTVADTIGCGDAFLAAFLRYRFTGNTLETALANAVLTGAFIAKHKGGCPSYALADLEAFIEKNSE